MLSRLMESKASFVLLKFLQTIPSALIPIVIIILLKIIITIFINNDINFLKLDLSLILLGRAGNPNNWYQS